ncbi:unnamed protein product [Closterium sp. NIES-54]
MGRWNPIIFLFVLYPLPLSPHSPPSPSPLSSRSPPSPALAAAATASGSLRGFPTFGRAGSGSSRPSFSRTSSTSSSTSASTPTSRSSSFREGSSHAQPQPVQANASRSGEMRIGGRGGSARGGAQQQKQQQQSQQQYEKEQLKAPISPRTHTRSGSITSPDAHAAADGGGGGGGGASTPRPSSAAAFPMLSPRIPGGINVFQKDFWRPKFQPVRSKSDMNLANLPSESGSEGSQQEGSRGREAGGTEAEAPLSAVPAAVAGLVRGRKGVERVESTEEEEDGELEGGFGRRWMGGDESDRESEGGGGGGRGGSGGGGGGGASGANSTSQLLSPMPAARALRGFLPHSRTVSGGEVPTTPTTPTTPGGRPRSRGEGGSGGKRGLFRRSESGQSSREQERRGKEQPNQLKQPKQQRPERRSLQQEQQHHQQSRLRYQQSQQQQREQQQGKEREREEEEDDGEYEAPLSPQSREIRVGVCMRGAMGAHSPSPHLLPPCLYPSLMPSPHHAPLPFTYLHTVYQKEIQALIALQHANLAEILGYALEKDDVQIAYDLPPCSSLLSVPPSRPPTQPPVMSPSLTHVCIQQKEIQALIALQHANLAEILGYALEKDDVQIAYDLPPNSASLENYLFPEGVDGDLLPWRVRVKVAIGGAKGLCGYNHLSHPNPTRYHCSPFPPLPILSHSNDCSFPVFPEGVDGDLLPLRVQGKVVISVAKGLALSSHMHLNSFPPTPYTTFPHCLASEGVDGDFLPLRVRVKVAISTSLPSPFPPPSTPFIITPEGVDGGFLPLRSYSALLTGYGLAAILAKGSSKKILKGAEGMGKDAFDFGVVLFSLLTGRQGAHSTAQQHGAEALFDWAEPYTDDLARSAECGSATRRMVVRMLDVLAKECMQDDPRCRPSMEDLVLWCTVVECGEVLFDWAEPYTDNLARSAECGSATRRMMVRMLDVLAKDTARRMVVRMLDVLAKECMQDDPRCRPSMEDLVTAVGSCIGEWHSAVRRMVVRMVDVLAKELSEVEGLRWRVVQYSAAHGGVHAGCASERVHAGRSLVSTQHGAFGVTPAAQVATAAGAAHATDAEHTPAPAAGPSRQRQRRWTAVSSPDATTAPALTQALTPDQVNALLSLLQQQPVSVTAAETALAAASASAKNEDAKKGNGTRGARTNRHDNDTATAAPPAPPADNDTGDSEDEAGEAPVNNVNFNGTEHLPPPPFF